jgi:DNA modification methylase
MQPHYRDADVTVWHDDCLNILRTLPAASVDAVVTDPPYGLAEHRPADIAAALTAWLTGDRTHVPDGKGFMSCAWDRFVPPPAVWDECLRVVKPGGHLLAFAGARTADLMGMSIRLAGFEIRDGIDWIYASGFPKSRDVSKAIDAAAGAEREVTGVADARNANTRTGVWGAADPDSPNYTGSTFGTGVRYVTAPATDEARRWQGWGTALKPAREPVVWAQKPLNLVPLDWRLVANVHHALAGLLWLSLSPAKRAELSSPSKNPEPPGAWCASARVTAALATSPDESGATGTFSSPALASTCSNIARSWNATLAALSDPTRTSTTSTVSSTTTALRTLNSLLAPITSPTTTPACGCLHGGPSSAAPSAASGSSDAWSSWLDTLSRSVPETATEGIALAASSALASIAADLSSGPAAASSADPAATARADERRSPAREPIVVARKPLASTVVGNVLAYGTGALNIDACRVGTSGRPAREVSPVRPDVTYAGTSLTGRVNGSLQTSKAVGTTDTGRWPTNVVYSHAPDCNGQCVPGCPVAELDRQSGTSVSDRRPNRNGSDAAAATFGLGRTEGQQRGHSDSGGASRFFPVFRYEPKAPTSERPRVDGVAHSTVKPLDLMRWLVRLVTPPGGTVLEPFAGSGTTVEACILEGFRCIAVEREAAYLPLIVARLSKPMQPALNIFGDAP